MYIALRADVLGISSERVVREAVESEYPDLLLGSPIPETKKNSYIATLS